MNEIEHKMNKPKTQIKARSSKPDYTLNINRRIRVFVSSTFHDMIEERDALMTHTWPELRRFCSERQVELIEVDMRWGITEQQSTRKGTLKLCLDEIHACRPFFIGILGERYGWIPSDDSFTVDLKEEQPWLKGLHGKSVTELEILHGVLNNPDMAERAFFYFRDPVYARSRGVDFLPENTAAAEKQATLKNLIRTTCKRKRIPLYENYSDASSLATLVLEQLKVAINTQFPIKSILDPLTREAYDQEIFAEIRRRCYIGRPDYFDVLDHHIEDVGPPLILLGDSGIGKSSLLANWINHWRKIHPKDFIFQHYIGSTPDSTSHWKLMSRLIAAIKRWSGDDKELPLSHDDTLRDFSLYCAKARIKAQQDKIRFIVVLDALNQLEDIDHSHLLGWLPSQPFFGPLRLIVSTLPGDTLEALEERRWTTLHIQPLKTSERRRMIITFLARFRKKLDTPRINRICNMSAAANPLYLKILLDELRVTGTHDNLDVLLDNYLASLDVPMLLCNVLARYQRDYEQDRPGLVSEALGLIWASRRGLAEIEILQLLHTNGLPQLPLATWSPLRAALEEGLVNRGGILNFGYSFLRLAVEVAFVPDQNRRDEFRLRLADYFEAQPVTERNCDELPWLLWQSEKRIRLKKCLLNIEYFLKIVERDQEELTFYWVWLNQENSMGKPYLASFKKWSKKQTSENDRISYCANHLGYFLHNAAFYAEAELLYRSVLQIKEIDCEENDPNITRDLNCLAQLLRDTNRLKEAEPLIRRALQINENSLGKNHPDVAVSLNSLAQVLHETNRISEAESLMRRALRIHEKYFGKDHPMVATRLNNLAQLLQATDRLKEAESLMRRALKIDETRLGKNHPELATDLNNLAMLLHANNRFDEAELLMRRALHIDESCLGKDHPRVARDLNNLATVLHVTKRLKEAERLYRMALQIDETIFGKNHPNVAGDLNNLTYLLLLTNRLKEAWLLSRRIIEIYLKFTRDNGYTHPNLQTSINNYTSMLQAMGWNEEQIREQLREIAPDFF